MTPRSRRIAYPIERRWTQEGISTTRLTSRKELLDMPVVILRNKSSFDLNPIRERMGCGAQMTLGRRCRQREGPPFDGKNVRPK